MQPATFRRAIVPAPRRPSLASRMGQALAYSAEAAVELSCLGAFVVAVALLCLAGW